MKPKLSFLSQEEIEKIHNKALEILETTGIDIKLPEAVEILKSEGCLVKEGSIVNIPREVVEKTLTTIPRRDEVTLYARKPDHDINLAESSPVLAAMVEATSVIDLYTRKKRPATNRDLAQSTQILELLENVSIASPPLTPQDVPHKTTDWYTWATSFSNTTKHITGPGTGARCVKDAVKMASLVVGGEDEFLKRPFFSLWILTTPPMKVDPLTLEALIEGARRKIPLIISSGPILGVTAPVTIAGSCAMAHSEILACLTLSQLVNPGAPAVYTSFARSMDFKIGHVSMASPEFTILKGCMGQMGRYLGLPTRMPAMLRDAKILDAQAGFETAMTGMSSALSADIMDGMQFDMDMVVDFADFAFCDEAIAQLKRVVRDVVVNEDTLAGEVIGQVAHNSNFLATEHTVNYFKQEIYEPRIFERRMWGAWEDDGALDMRDKMILMTRDILENKAGPVLDADMIKELEKIAEAANLA